MVAARDVERRHLSPVACFGILYMCTGPYLAWFVMATCKYNAIVYACKRKTVAIQLQILEFSILCIDHWIMVLNYAYFLIVNAFVGQKRLSNLN